MKQLFSKLWPIGFILIVWLTFSWPFFAKGLIPFPSNYLVSFFPPWQYFYQLPIKNPAMPDVLSQLYPWRQMVVESFKIGQFPLWNPYLFSGTPLLANFQSAVFSPLNFLFFIFPLAVGWSLAILAQPLLAALFMFLFLRELRISQWGSLMGAIAFAFCGFVVVWMAYGTLSLAVVWLPLLLLTIEKSFNKINALALSLISVALAFSIFSGHFQTSIYVVFVGALYAFFKFWQTKKIHPFLLVSGFLLLGSILALPQIIPSIELYLQSVRGVSFKQTEAIPWYYLVTILAPDFFGNPATQNNWFGHYAEWAGFFGVWPLLLGIFAIWQERKRKEVLFFAILGLAGLLFALQTPLADLLVKLQIPVLSTSAASRLIVIFSFSLAVLSGFGIDRLLNMWAKREFFKKVFTYLLLVGFIFIILWLALLLTQILPADKLLIAKRNLFLPSLIFASGALIVLAGFFLKKPLRIVLILAILLLTAFDLLRFAKKWMPFEGKENLYPQLSVIQFLQKEVGSNRVFGNFGNELSVYFHIPSIEGYDPLYQKRYKELVSASSDGKIGDLFSDRSTVLLSKNGKYSKQLLSLLGVKYILHAKDDGWSPWVFPFWKNLDQYDLVYDGPKYQVLRNRVALPRAFLVGDYEVVGDKQEIIDHLLSDNFDLRNKLVLEEKIPEKISSGSGEAKIIRYDLNVVNLEVDQNTPQLLFLSDNYYPGWQAKVDGQKTKIYRADYTFRAVFVPQGRHLVEFVYDPVNFKIGFLLSGGVLLFLFFLNVRWIARRNEK